MRVEAQDTNQEEAHGMRRHHYRIRLRIWLALAVAIASLGFASSAGARLYTGDLEGPSTASPAPVVVSTGGFNWGDALVGAGVAVGAMVGGIGIAYTARKRIRLAV
jgi:predicted anti-sigma-YlaC factor YlaD